MRSGLRSGRLAFDAVRHARSALATPCASRCRLTCRALPRAPEAGAAPASSQAAPTQARHDLPDTQTPLHERPAVHAAAQAELDAWRRAALEAAERVAAGWREPDDPSVDDLKTELRWLLEDAVEAHQTTTRQASHAGPVKLRLALAELRQLWHRRLADREPLQYLTNAAHWRDLVLAVGPGALIPRPETEQIVDFALQAVRQDAALAGGPWADLGTGSGALALGLATALPQLPQVWAVDSSAAACAWAQHNAQRLRVADRVQVRQGSWLGPLEPLRGQLAGILSNPPYIEQEVLPSLQAEVRLHEPASALDGGAGAGRDCLQLICSQAAAFLRPGGFLALETGGPHQTRPVAEQLAGSFTAIECRSDLFGVERFVTALRC